MLLDTLQSWRRPDPTSSTPWPQRAGWVAVLAVGLALFAGYVALCGIGLWQMAMWVVGR